MPMLPNLNQQAQGMNVQRPQLPGVQQTQATMASQATPPMGARPFSGMAPDNGQHGGAPRYQTPTSGALGQSVARAMPQPFPNATAGGQRPQNRSQGQQAVFDPNRVAQTAETLQNAMPFNQALRERFLAMARPQQQQTQPGFAQPLPPMFNR